MVEPSKEILQRRARNLLAPIFRLTDEVLLLVFTLNCRIQLEIFYCEIHDPGPLYTTKATSQVCYHWRLLCLSTSILWSHIDLETQRDKWIDETLRRSSQSSVALRGYDDDEEVFTSLLPRMRAFTGAIRKKEWVILINEVQRPGSKLQSLVLQNNEDDEGALLALTVDQIPSHSLPIKQLAVSQFDIINLDLSLFSNLTSLAMYEVQAFEALALLNGLARLPGLIELSLTDACKSAPSNLNIMVHLPNLTRLALATSLYGSDDTGSLLPYLHIPTTCVILLVYSAHLTYKVLTYKVLLPLLSTPQFAIPESQSLNLMVTSEYMQINNVPAGLLYFCVPLFDAASTVDKIICDCMLRHSSVTVNSPNKIKHKEAWKRSLNECLSLLFGSESLFSSITTLQLYVPYRRIEDKFPLQVGVFQHITTLFVETRTLGWLLSVVLVDNQGTILFPSLKKLGLTVNGGFPYIDRLVSYLSWRRARNAAIDTLELRYPSSDEKWTSHVSAAQHNELLSLGVTIDLFYVVDGRYLVRTEFEEADICHLKPCTDPIYQGGLFEDEHFSDNSEGSSDDDSDESDSEDSDNSEDEL